MSKNSNPAVSESDGVPLSERLDAIARYVPADGAVADIGADHAQLLISLARSGRLKRGIAGEVNLGPYHNARQRVAASRFENRIDVRRGDGLNILAPDEADVIVIAGMGGALIASILESGNNRLRGVQRLILQPNNGAERVRLWLAENGWELRDEELVRDGGILYEILVAEPGMPERPYEALPLTREKALQIGPVLWRKRHPFLKSRLEKELAGWERILQKLQSGRTREAEERRRRVTEEIGEWRRMIEWLSEEET
ncbi:tRNA (adenine(22)-N(1))-methyltransferase [Paludifilum halophilum]|nr:class I SAM-dependent methyltransferase [Paludifilum halophilum]